MKYVSKSVQETYNIAKKINPLLPTELLNAMNEMYERKDEIKREEYRKFALEHTWDKVAKEVLSFMEDVMDNSTT